MLVGIAINPDCFGPEVVVNEDTRRGAESVLRASLGNAILLGVHGEDFFGELLSAASRIGSALGPQIQMLAVEVRKSGKDCLAKKAQALSTGASPIDRLRQLVVDTAPDVVVCASVDQVRELRNLDSRIELCSLANFPKTAAEARRTEWNTSQRLDQLGRDDCRRLIGSAIRYGEELTIADKMISRAAKSGVHNLRRFVRGVVYIAELWCEFAPNTTGHRAYVKIITQGGATGAAAGYIDPNDARDLIQRTIRSMDASGAIERLEMRLKSEANPPIFMDRLLASGRRVWGIRHGFDHIGNLACAPNRRSPTFIDADCGSNRELLRCIRALPEAD